MTTSLSPTSVVDAERACTAIMVLLGVVDDPPEAARPAAEPFQGRPKQWSGGLARRHREAISGRGRD